VLVAGGPAAPWDATRLLPEWQGQAQGEHGVRLPNELFLGGPVFRQPAHRLVSRRWLMRVGGLGAGLLERQRRRTLAERYEPIYGLRPDGRDTLKPTVARILRAFADSRLVRLKRADGRLVGRQWARPPPVQQPILEGLEIPHPEVWFGASFPRGA
jgi:hypothetical protein